MENFDDLPIQEKIKIFNESGEKLAEAMKPVVERLIKAFREIGKAMAHVVDGIFTNEFHPNAFNRMYLSEMKKERHRKSYYRMMARRNKKNSSSKLGLDKIERIF